MQLENDMRPPASGSVWNLNFEGFSSPLDQLRKIGFPSQVSNFGTRGASVAKCHHIPQESLVKIEFDYKT